VTETRARFRYAPETAVVETALAILALAREAILAAHLGLLDEQQPASHERRLAIALIESADRFARHGRRYLDYVEELAAPSPESSDPRQVEMF
jgi:hypothetical protein